MTQKELPKVYEPGKVEKKWLERWLSGSAFTADPGAPGEPFTMVIPPPNITGSLHLGHALNNTLQDIMARYKRMDGYKVLWVPGIDHAGIATQNVIEKQLHNEGTDRHAIGREKFVERVWKWKEASGDTIVTQLKRLGASCDWSRQRFTMDEGLSKAVRKVFVELYKKDLIYRGDYIINWCPRCHTALSDLESEANEKQGSLWNLVYPATEGSAKVTVATTRPETMLGDVAVAVNPKDDRYKDLIGKTLRLPLADREIPVIADPHVDMEFGTGAVKITPAHDFSDFEMAGRHDLEFITVMDMDARMNDNVPEKYRGLDRYEARKKVVEDLKAEGLLGEINDYTVRLGACYRCHTVVEPTLSKQWFVKIGPLAAPAIKAVEDGKTKFVPKNWEKTYFEWMRNIRDWCISRQIWWGHRIPAWHCDECGETTVSETDPGECGKCSSKDIMQDPDVLDTWFSSALWPFTTLGWPGDTKDLKAFYPTSVLFTSFDIIFFWVARMMMMGLEFKGEVPFKEVYIHALVRDEKGQKMSKSKGNVIDPLIIMDKFGTDALRFTLAAMAAQGRDIKLSEDRVEGYRNFCNKIWNLTRFTMMNLPEGYKGEGYKADHITDADKWILTHLSTCITDVRSNIEGYRFDAAARVLYDFSWHKLCDWYVELIKPDLWGDKGDDRKAASIGVLVTVLRDTMKLLHPFMPFITEEIYSTLPGPKGLTTDGLLMEESFPKADKEYLQETSAMDTAIDIVRAIRNIRAESNLVPGAKLDAVCYASALKTDAVLKNEGHIMNLAKVDSLKVHDIKIDDERPKGAAFTLAGDVEVYVPLKGLIDVETETARLEKEFSKVARECETVEKKLGNEKFISRAPAEVVEKEKGKLVELTEKKAKVAASMERIRELAG